MSCGCPGSPIKFKKGTMFPFLEFQVSECDGGAIDFSNPLYTASVKMRKAGYSTTLETLTLSKLFGGFEGWFQLEWAAGTLDKAPGIYELEVTLDYDGSPQILNDLIRIQIVEAFA